MAGLSPAPSTTLVNVAEDAETRLVTVLTEAAAQESNLVTSSVASLAEDCHAQIEAGDAAGLITAIHDSGALQALFLLETTEEAVALISVLAASLHRVPSAEIGHKLLESVADAIFSAEALCPVLQGSTPTFAITAAAPEPSPDNEGHATAPSTADGEKGSTSALQQRTQQHERQLLETRRRKLSLLSVLYNMRSLGSEKCALVRRMMLVAGQDPEVLLSAVSALGQLLIDASPNAVAASGNTSASRKVDGGQGSAGRTLITTTVPTSSHHTLTPSFPQLVGLLDSWNVSLEERQNLYQTICAVLPVADVRRQRFLLLWVETYTSDTHPSADVFAAAEQAVIGAIRDPVSLFAHQRTLVRLPAVQALENKSETAGLWKLLQVFHQGKLSDYDSLLQEQGGPEVLLQPWGLDHDACRRNMRILSLCSLAAEYDEIPYSVVAETLKLDQDAMVETWVIAAVGSGLLQAKMDQLAQQVMVERCVLRRFDMDQWKLLQKRLTSWKQNVGQVLASLKQSTGGSGSFGASTNSTH